MDVYFPYLAICGWAHLSKVIPMGSPHNSIKLRASSKKNDNKFASKTK